MGLNASSKMARDIRRFALGRSAPLEGIWDIPDVIFMVCVLLCMNSAAAGKTTALP